MAALEKKPFNTSWNSSISKSGRMGGSKFGRNKLILAAVAVVVVAGLVLWLSGGGDTEGETAGGAAPKPTQASQALCDKGAKECYLAAAEGGDPSSQFKLAMAYATGDGIVQDLTEASKWYAKAVEANFPDAQYYMGEIYYHGRGVPKDFAQAGEWYSKASAQGHKGAKERLGQIAKETGAN